MEYSWHHHSMESPWTIHMGKNSWKTHGLYNMKLPWIFHGILMVSPFQTLALYKSFTYLLTYLLTYYDEKLTCSFFARVEWKQARALRRSRIVTVSQSNRNCNHGITLIEHDGVHPTNILHVRIHSLQHPTHYMCIIIVSPMFEITLRPCDRPSVCLWARF